MNFEPILPSTRITAMQEAGFWRGHLLTDFLDRFVAERPEALAIVDHNSMTGLRTALTYSALNARVSQIAGGLMRLGVGRGDVVSYQLPNWWEFAALHLACLRIGAATNPLMPIFRERELEFMLSLAESKVFIVPREFRGFDFPGMAENLRPKLPKLEHVLVVGGSGANSFEARLLSGADAGPSRDVNRLSANDVIQVMYTSGTTGEPKGVMHTSNTLFSNVIYYAERLGLGAKDVVFMGSPLAHQTGFMYGFIMPLYLGCPAIFLDIWQAQRAADIIAMEKATFTMASTPFLTDLTEVAEARPEAFESLRIFLAGGAPIPRVLVPRATKALRAHIVSGWGMTENGALTTTKLDDPPEKVFETDGCPLPGMAIRVVDAADKVLPVGAEGRLQARGCSNFVGYLKRPQLYGMDAEGWFETGDLARIDADGYVRITGRSKDIIIRGGENIPVVEIEELIYRHPDVQEAAIVAMPDPRLGERVCAFVVLRAGKSLTLGDIVAHLNGHNMAKQYLPERLEVVEALPKTPSGKIQKFKLRETAKSLQPAR